MATVPASARRANVLVPVLVAATAVSFVPPPAQASTAETPAPLRLLDVTPERLAAFRDAWTAFTAAEPVPHADDGLMLVSVWEARRTTNLTSALASDEPLAPGGRDVVAEEDFLIAGREEEHETAMRRWLARRFKGSDGRRERDGIELRTGWNHGPLLGLAAGPWYLSVGRDLWKFKATWRRDRTRGGGPWSVSGYVSREDGDVRAGFLVGRSLLASRLP